jgi:hypothetical protein
LLSAHKRHTEIQLHQLLKLYVNLTMRREYSSSGHSGSTSTTSYAVVTSSSGCMTTWTTISTSKLVENGFHGINN